MQSTNTIPIEVGDLLSRERTCRRKPGEVPYPIDYSLVIANHDTWNNMFIMESWNRVSIYDYKTPPKMVLDLGCGTGYWVIEAARQWTDSQFVGYDIVDIQPRLSAIDPHKGLRSRVAWVHGNMLNGLPFPPEHFDFVRAVGLDMAIPEDELQGVLEDIHRVLKPGGIFEILTEDLIFPTGPKPFVDPEPSIKSPLLAAFPSTDSLDSADSIDDITIQGIESDTFSATDTLSSTTDTISSTLGGSIDRYSSVFSNRNTNDSRQRDMSSLRRKDSMVADTPSSFIVDRQSSVYGTFRRSNDPWQFEGLSSEHHLKKKHSHMHFPEGYSSLRKSDPTFVSLPADSPLTPEAHPQDHSRLQAAWEAMISARFLALHSTTVAPFYINNTFTTVNAFPILEIPIPRSTVPRSETTDRDSSETHELIHIDGVPVGWDLGPPPPGEPNRLIYPPDTSKRPGPPNAAHLKKTVDCVAACKEKIWVEYKRLYKEETPSVKTRRPLGRDDALREVFEAAWDSWSCDMADRVGSRDYMVSVMDWRAPEDSKPDTDVWRKNLETYYKSREEEGLPLPKYNSYTPPCRTLRAFIAHKD